MNRDQTQGTAAIKGRAGTVSTDLMDDAPLFAGLEGFVLSHAVKTKPESRPPAAPKPEKAARTRRKIPAKPAGPQPARATKTHAATASDSAAVLLTVAEMCRLLSISRATLVRMDNAGKLPGRIKLGGSVRFHRATVEDWLQSLISSSPST